MFAKIALKKAERKQEARQVRSVKSSGHMDESERESDR